MQSNFAANIAATLGISSPFWMAFVAPAHSILLAVLGIVLLVLTIRNKWLDNRIKIATLRDIKINTSHEEGASDE